MAEWGDRTQFVMISLHASQPLWPVIFGSALSFALLCSSAVLCAMAIEKSLVNFKLTKRTLNLIVAVAFVCFAFISLHDAIHDQEDGE
jgi:putative Ca2+/H+ antiporter (TMEM165/GDT1 family)